MNPILKLVGAGPGDPELLTVKGYKAIQNANAILYDALIDKSILNIAAPNAKLTYVGKRAGQHSFSQDEINALIVEYAFKYNNVVRLKGGDPMVYGRGHEEYDHASAYGIDTEFIPGITSSISVPEILGIPVTRRGTSQSFWVLTATNSERKLTADIKQAVHTDATVVILMGMNKLNQIVQLYKQHQRDNTPVAIIQNGSRPDEKVGIGTIANILEIKREQQLGTPAIIVIGNVVNLRNKVNEAIKTTQRTDEVFASVKLN